MTSASASASTIETKEGDEEEFDSVSLEDGVQGQRKSNANEEDEEALRLHVRRYVLGLRLLYVVAAIMIGVSAVLAITGEAGAFLAAYGIFFSCLLCCTSSSLIEATRLRSILYFGFMYKSIGRLIFTLIVSLMLLDFGLLGLVSLGLLMITTLTHIVLECKYGALFRKEFKK